MDNPATAAAPAASEPTPVTETVTLTATGQPAELPKADADALLNGGLATLPVAEAEPPQTIVLLANAGEHRAGAVLTVPAALAVELGAKARPATPADQEIAWPNVRAVTSL